MVKLRRTGIPKFSAQGKRAKLGGLANVASAIKGLCVKLEDWMTGSISSFDVSSPTAHQHSVRYFSALAYFYAPQCLDVGR